MIVKTKIDYEKQKIFIFSVMINYHENQYFEK